MSLSPTCEEFLITTMGLPREQVIAIYNAGDPWPLWEMHNIHRAGVIAQARALPFPDVLGAVQVAVEAEIDATRSRLQSDDIGYGSVSVEERNKIVTSLSWLKESTEHMEWVMVRTRASWDVVSRLSSAIQRYALMNPGWELVSPWPHARHGLPD